MRLFSISILIIALNSLFLYAQVPSACFEIESILVDACVPGSPCTNAASPSCSCEGKNEMVRFRVGSSPLNTSVLSVTWPNNSWLGLCQNPTTAAHVAAMNSTVQNCGLFLEPVGNILPAGSEVLFITSTDFCVSAHSFANLSDTVYVIFQCAGNFQGHFANYGTGLRTLSMSFGAGCSDQVTYDRALLLNQSLVPGAGDGARVDFAWNGTPTYANDGCSAPLSPQIVNAGNDLTACPGDIITLSAFVQGSFTAYNWSGGSGVFSNPNQLNTTYQVGMLETGNITLTFQASNCNGNVSDQINIQVNTLPTVSVMPVGPVNLCAGDTLTLTASGNGTYLWNTGSTSSSISVVATGTYTVTSSNVCGSSSTSIVVQDAGTAPFASISAVGSANLCPGDQVQLNASGNSNYQWSSGASTSSILVSTAGIYTVTVSNACGSSTASISITSLPAPTVSVMPVGPVNLCAGDTLTLTASGNGTYLWNTGSTSSSISVVATGTYTVTSSNVCGSSSTSIVVQDAGTAPIASISAVGSATLCPGDQVQLNATGNGNYQWSSGASTSSIQVSSAGTYTVTVSNACGSSTASISVTSLPEPSVTILQGDTVFICENQTLQLQAASATPVIWSNGSTNEIVVISQPGLYFVTTTTTCGTDSAFIWVIETDISVNFIPSVLSGQAPLEVNFINQSQAANAFQWNFGNGITSTLVNPSHTYINPGVYQVVLIGTNAYGCSDTASVFIDVDSCSFEFFVPNTFTPNGDGINDVFEFNISCVDQATLLIFNRWGNKIYQMTNENPFWNGTTSTNSEAVPGIYVFILEWSDWNGNTNTQNGFIHLFK